MVNYIRTFCLPLDVIALDVWSFFGDERGATEDIKALGSPVSTAIFLAVTGSFNSCPSFKGSE